MKLFRLFLNGFLSTLTIFLVFGTLYFFWATESQGSELVLKLGNLLVYSYKPEPPGFGFGNGTLLIGLLGGFLNLIIAKILHYRQVSKK